MNLLLDEFNSDTWPSFLFRFFSFTDFLLLMKSGTNLDLEIWLEWQEFFWQPSYNTAQEESLFYSSIGSLHRNFTFSNNDILLKYQLMDYPLQTYSNIYCFII